MKDQVESLPSNSCGCQEPLPGASGSPFHHCPALAWVPAFPSSGESQQLPASGQLFTVQIVIYATTLYRGTISPIGQMKALRFREVKGGPGILPSVLPSVSLMIKVC